ncbi:hypothetical protein CVU76_00575 [Candidatus Dojkabacteria bacterium HGW-Dojkabacteria-1]|uniref:Purple acid phosphatase N-terminal domain-containing protein n=1 Tax=Candidatus Dojkabacteria bacterium HGW-Dojkabacteria-1 TaxID=2013761 RepID=A0A2N2F2R6_9BACT|nr:MAG: hypothetical protein CVU76_00575 [Candidatus Dojkabacteria bacterium HGW-Dojkabacteria-1]
MKNRGIFTIGVVLTVLMIFVGVFVFKASGSNDSVSVEGCNPYNVEIKKGEKENSVEITWKSKTRCSAYILYGTEMKNLNLVAIDLEGDFRGKNHKVVINSLLSSKTYFFSIVSGGTTYGKDGLPISFSISSL